MHLTVRSVRLLTVLALAGCSSTPSPRGDAALDRLDGGFESDASTQNETVRDASVPANDAEPFDASKMADSARDAGAPALGDASSEAAKTAPGAGSGGSAGRAAAGGADEAGQAGSSSSAPSGSSFIRLTSDSGDYIGAGATYDYTLADSVFTLSTDGPVLTVSVHGDQQWDGVFALPSDFSELRPGEYDGLGNYSSQDSSPGGLAWRGEGRACDRVDGWIAIDGVSYESGQLTALDLRFSQICDSSKGALHGQIHWLRDDPTLPPGPVNPPPAKLWRAADGVTPASGNYVYLLGDSGAYIINGVGYVYTQSDAILTVTSTDGKLSIRIDGEESWTGDFVTMVHVDSLQPGYYANLRSGPANPARGTLDWSGEGRGCDTRESWFVIDHAEYDAKTLTAVDLRFEQHCQSSNETAAVHGQIHWRADDKTAPPPPVKPPPSDLWRAPASSVPAGSYVYLESAAGDPIGSGKTYLYTQASAVLSVMASGKALSVGVKGDENWSGAFEVMSGVDELEPAYYANAEVGPFQNPTRPRVDWSGSIGSCSKIAGWFAVDTITYEAGVLTALDLRFEQRCTSSTAALHGQVHWIANDPTRPPGPVNPPPADLWKPAASVVPASGNYAYFESEAGDFVGGGKVFQYPSTTPLTVMSLNDGASIRVADWSASFIGMAGIGQLAPGYYGSLGKPSNPTRGSLDVSGQSHGCNKTTGWFAVDDVAYASGNLTALALRFEQHCEDTTPALHGAIRFAATQ